MVSGKLISRITFNSSVEKKSSRVLSVKDWSRILGF